MKYKQLVTIANNYLLELENWNKIVKIWIEKDI